MTTSTHYVAMSGAHGCLPDFCTSCESHTQAVDVLADLFELGRNRRRDLASSDYLELRPNRDGAEYCEITSCDCENPDVHCDS